MGLFWDMKAFSISGIPSNYGPYFMSIPFLYWANINLARSDLTLHFVSNIAFQDDRFAFAHRPRIEGYKEVKITKDTHYYIWVGTSLIFGFWASYSCVGLLKGLRPTQTLKLKKD